MRRILLFFPLLLFAREWQSDGLYKVRNGQIKEAIDLFKEEGKSDLEFIHQVCLALINQGAHSLDPKDQLLAIYGAGMSRSPKLLHILEAGLESPIPQIQLSSLQFLKEMKEDRADECIKAAMNSPYLLIRLEAVHHLALQKDNSATDRIDGLMRQVDAALFPLFPPLLALCEDSHSTAMLKNFFTDKNVGVRLMALLACIDYSRDDMLPQIRSLACCGNIEEQEAAAFGLGVFKDLSSCGQLAMMTRSVHENVRLAAALSLYRLGQLEQKEILESRAKSGSLPAIMALEHVGGSEEVLAKLVLSTHLPIRANAALALLKKRDERCLCTLTELLVRDSRDLAIIERYSPGGCLPYFQVLPSSEAKLAPDSLEAEMALALKEELVRSALDLPRPAFFELAKAILSSKDPQLVPVLISCVESLRDKEARQFLTLELQRLGAPLVRAYCNLALFRLGERGPYDQYVKQWVKNLKEVELIHFRPLIPRNRGASTYSLTPQETCRLFVESITALANHKDADSLDALLVALSLGHPSNRFALAGIIIRAIE